MNSSELKERILLQRPTATPDGMGGIEAGWEVAFETRARFRYLRGTESVMAGRLQGKLTVVMMIPASHAARAVTPDWRVRDARSDDFYNVRSIIPSDDRRWLELTCESGVAA